MRWWRPIAIAIRNACACVAASASLIACNSVTPLPASRRPIALDRIPIEYDVEQRDVFAVSEAQWRDIAAYFSDVRDGTEEREAIALAVARLEQIAGEQTPIANDDRKNYGRGPGKTDCLDESTNTTTFLCLMRERGLLRHNRVMNKALRGPIHVDIHWTAVVQDVDTKQPWVIDSWYNANGLPPIVQPLDDWLAKKPVPGYYADGTQSDS